VWEWQVEKLPELGKGGKKNEWGVTCLVIHSRKNEGRESGGGGGSFHAGSIVICMLPVVVSKAENHN